jgi:hypothetical protein
VDARPLRPRDEDGLATDGAEGAHGAVDSAGDDRSGALEEGPRLGVGHAPPIEAFATPGQRRVDSTVRLVSNGLVSDVSSRGWGVAMQRLIDELLSRFPAGDAGLIALVDLTVLVAIADGSIGGAEMAVLTESIEAMMGSRLEASLVDHLVTESLSQIRVLGADASARDIGEVLAAHHAGEEGVRLAIAIALASEGLSAPELERIGEIAHAAGVSASLLDDLIAAEA